MQDWLFESLAIASLVVMAFASGCGGDGGVPRYDISGTATFDGKPIPQGVIQFLPDAAKGNKGPATNANIVDGTYDTSASGKAPIGGEHIVIISGFDGNARPDEELPYGLPLFSEFRTAADLPKVSGETVDFEVQP